LNRFPRSLLTAATLAAFAAAAASSCGDAGSIGDGPNPNHGIMGPVPPDTAGSTGNSGSAGDTGAGTAGTTTPPATGGAIGTAGTTTPPATGGTTGSAGATTTPTAGTTGAAGSTGKAGSTGTGVAGTTGASGATGTAGAGGSSLPPVTTPHCKRGEAYGANSLADLQALSKGISWWYNWSPSPDKTAGAWAMTGVEFVPMVWGQKGGPPDPATIEKQIPAGSRYILGFNEPNRGDQSNITAAQAAALWPRIEQIAKDKNLLIGSPSPQYCAGDCNDTDPFHWLDAFFAACPNCKVDFMATHWYACTGDALKSHLSKFKKYGRPIWVTEFSCMDAGDHSAAGEAAYMKTAIDILEKDPTVFRYSWFTGRWPAMPGINLLGAGSGTLTDLGTQYITLPASSTCGQ
jgi:hypothetical protein